MRKNSKIASKTTAFFLCNNMMPWHFKSVLGQRFTFREALGFCHENFNSTIKSFYSAKGKNLLQKLTIIRVSDKQMIELNYKNRNLTRVARFWTLGQRLNSSHFIDENNQIGKLASDGFPSTVCLTETWKLINKVSNKVN